MRIRCLAVLAFVAGSLGGCIMLPPPPHHHHAGPAPFPHGGPPPRCDMDPPGDETDGAARQAPAPPFRPLEAMPSAPPSGNGGALR